MNKRMSSLAPAQEPKAKHLRIKCVNGLYIVTLNMRGSRATGKLREIELWMSKLGWMCYAYKKHTKVRLKR